MISIGLSGMCVGAYIYTYVGHGAKGPKIKTGGGRGWIIIVSITMTFLMVLAGSVRMHIHIQGGQRDRQDKYKIR